MSFSILFILLLFLGMGLSYMPFFRRCSLLWWIWAPCSSWKEHKALRGLSRTWMDREGRGEEKFKMFKINVKHFPIIVLRTIPYSTQFKKKNWLNPPSLDTNSLCISPLRLQPITAETSFFPSAADFIKTTRDPKWHQAPISQSNGFYPVHLSICCTYIKCCTYCFYVL